MRKWLYDRPWIWIVVFLSCLVAGSVATLVIAERNKPEIVKPGKPAVAYGRQTADSPAAAMAAKGAGSG